MISNPLVPFADISGDSLDGLTSGWGYFGIGTSDPFTRQPWQNMNLQQQRDYLAEMLTSDGGSSGSSSSSSGGSGGKKSSDGGGREVFTRTPSGGGGIRVPPASAPNFFNPANVPDLQPGAVHATPDPRSTGGTLTAEQQRQRTAALSEFARPLPRTRTEPPPVEADRPGGLRGFLRDIGNGDLLREGWEALRQGREIDRRGLREGALPVSSEQIGLPTSSGEGRTGTPETVTAPNTTVGSYGRAVPASSFVTDNADFAQRARNLALTSLTRQGQTADLVHEVYRKLGVAMPRRNEAQAAFGRSVSLAATRPGDMIVTDSRSGDRVVGIYIGEGRMVAPGANQFAIRNVDEYKMGSLRGVRVEADYSEDAPRRESSTQRRSTPQVHGRNQTHGSKKKDAPRRASQGDGKNRRAAPSAKKNRRAPQKKRTNKRSKKK